MSRATIVQGVLEHGTSAAVFVNGVLEDFVFGLDDDRIEAGTVVRAVADRKLKSSGAWILRLPGDQFGYLRSAESLRQGESIVVQTQTHPEPGKHVSVSQRIELRGGYAVVSPSKSGIRISKKISDADTRKRLQAVALANGASVAGRPGLTLRSSAQFADDRDLELEIHDLFERASKIESARPHREADFICFAPKAIDQALAAWGGRGFVLECDYEAYFRYEIHDLLFDYMEPKVGLATGANMWIEQTRALLTVDVNTGSDTTEKAALKANLAAAAALPRHFRIRGLGGQVAIDFAPVKKNERIQVEAALKKAFDLDQTATTLSGWSRLGLYELHRRRDRRPLEQWIER